MSKTTENNYLVLIEGRVGDYYCCNSHRFNENEFRKFKTAVENLKKLTKIYVETVDKNCNSDRFLDRPLFKTVREYYFDLSDEVNEDHVDQEFFNKYEDLLNSAAYFYLLIPESTDYHANQIDHIRVYKYEESENLYDSIFAM